jgi:predicted nuclease of predicted toxin-antitoxin system
VNIWLDAHLPPAIAPWIKANFQLDCISVRDLGLRDADDDVSFAAARLENVLVMTKDADFKDLVTRLGTPPQVIWIRYGNTSNVALKQRLQNDLPDALKRVQAGDPIVELG